MQKVNIDSVLTESEFAGKVHPTILRLGLAYANGTLRGSNARAVALLTALSQMFQVRMHCARPDFQSAGGFCVL